MNADLLRRIQTHILLHPADLDMSTYRGCIAHWACELSGEKLDRPREIRVRAAQLLNLNAREAAALFQWSGWLEPLKGQYWRADSAGKRAAVAAAWMQTFLELDEAAGKRFE
jgi:hypothetical protein